MRSDTFGMSESGVCILRTIASTPDRKRLWLSSTTLVALRNSSALGPFVANSSRIRMISLRISSIDSGAPLALISEVMVDSGVNCGFSDAKTL